MGIKAYAVDVALTLPIYVFPHSLRIAAILYSGGLIKGPAMFSNMVPSQYRFTRTEYTFRDDLSTSISMKSRHYVGWVQQVAGTVYVLPLGDVSIQRGRAAISQYNIVEVRAVRPVVIRDIPYPWNHVSLVNQPSAPPPFNGIQAEGEKALVCHHTVNGKLCALQPLVYRGERQQRIQTVYGPLPWRPAPFPGSDNTLQYFKNWYTFAKNTTHAAPQQGRHSYHRHDRRRGGRWGRRSYYR